MMTPAEKLYRNLYAHARETAELWEIDDFDLIREVARDAAGATWLLAAEKNQKRRAAGLPEWPRAYWRPEVRHELGRILDGDKGNPSFSWTETGDDGEEYTVEIDPADAIQSMGYSAAEQEAFGDWRARALSRAQCAALRAWAARGYHAHCGPLVLSIVNAARQALPELLPGNRETILLAGGRADLWGCNGPGTPEAVQPITRLGPLFHQRKPRQYWCEAGGPRLYAYAGFPVAPQFAPVIHRWGA